MLIMESLKCALPAVLIASSALAQEPTPTEAGAQSASPVHYGLLRSRDVTPFGFLRLDMQPAHAVSGPPGTWATELDLSYQNTWALSNNVRGYLESRGGGRQGIGPADVQAILALPGESYLVDLEYGLLEFTFHYQLAEHWEGYASASGVYYTGGFLDSTIESFHNALNIEGAGRKFVNRNQINIIYNLKSAQVVQPDLPEAGLLDPVLGLRYRLYQKPERWNLITEVAVKVPVAGKRDFLSTGHTDVGAQITLQGFAGRHAGYGSLSAVYTKPSNIAPTRTEVVPTAIVGYEFSLTQHTNLNAQLYVSPSVFKHSDTDLNELLARKYLASLGLRYHSGASVFTFALTENIQNFNNTPDISFQFSWAYSPKFMR